MEDIKYRLKAIRMMAKDIRKEAAHKCGASYAAYLTYERGTCYPPMEVVYKFCEVYNVSPSWLLGMSQDSFLFTDDPQTFYAALDITRNRAVEALKIMDEISLLK